MKDRDRDTERERQRERERENFLKGRRKEKFEKEDSDVEGGG